MRPLFVVTCALAAISTSAHAQTKQQLVEDWERQRSNVLAYIDAMPDSAMAFHPTAGVRDFAQQIVHAVSTNLEVAAIVTARPQGGALFARHDAAASEGGAS